MTNPALMKPLFDEMLAQSTFNVLNYSEHHFEPCGWTALWLLGESHFAVHTFPEHRKSYIELSSCMMDKYVLFLERLQQAVAFVETSERLHSFGWLWHQAVPAEKGEIQSAILTP